MSSSDNYNDSSDSNSSDSDTQIDIKSHEKMIKNTLNDLLKLSSNVTLKNLTRYLQLILEAYKDNECDDLTECDECYHYDCKQDTLCGHFHTLDKGHCVRHYPISHLNYPPMCCVSYDPYEDNRLYYDGPDDCMLIKCNGMKCHVGHLLNMRDESNDRLHCISCYQHDPHLIFPKEEYKSTGTIYIDCGGYKCRIWVKGVIRCTACSGYDTD